MKTSTKFLTLLAALAAGSASAAGVTAGTQIKNVAVASFDDPNGGGSKTSSSQEVVTTVLANPGFDIVYTDLTDGTTAGGTLPSNYEQSVKNGGEVKTAYRVINSGNVNNYVVSLAADTTGTSANSNPRPANTVLYFVDANGDGTLQDSERGVDGNGNVNDSLAVTSVTLNADDISTTRPNEDEGYKLIFQVIKVPAAANPGETYAASPRGTAYTYADGVNPGNATTTEAANDLQFSRALVYAPTVITTPPVTTPPTPTPNPPLPPVPTPPSPVYPDPNNPNTFIGVSGDNQYAYPKADGDVTSDKVTFINEVKNSGQLSDTVNLFPTNAGTVNNNDGTFTIPVTLPNGTAGTAVVKFLKADGSGPLPVVNNWPTLTVGANSSENYRVEITYPDYDATDTSDPAPITLTIGVDSGNDAGTLADDTTNDVIYPGQLQFGDATAGVGTVPTPTPEQTVVVAANTGLTPGNAGDRTAIFPMDVANTGEYADTYQLSGSVSVPVSTSATPTVVAVKYYIDTDGNNEPDTALTLTNGKYVTGTVQANAELKVWAVIDLPADALATNANGTNTSLVVSQSVTSVYSGITREDNNDLIKVTAVPADPNNPPVPPSTGVSVDKVVDKAQAKPGEVVKYTITAKNNFNAALKNFMVTESNANSANTNVFTWTTFKSVTATYSGSYVTGTVMYRFNGGSWSASVTAPANVTKVDVAVDTDGSGTITAADTMPAGAQLQVVMEVTVK